MHKIVKAWVDTCLKIIIYIAGVEQGAKNYPKMAFLALHGTLRRDFLKKGTAKLFFFCRVVRPWVEASF